MGLLHENWWIYILRCTDDSLYTGITNNILYRYWQHVNGCGGCKYTRSRLPVSMERCWIVENKSQALKIEHLLKMLKRGEKDLLVCEPDRLQTYATTAGYDFVVMVGDENLFNQLVKTYEKLTRKQAQMLIGQLDL